MNYKFYDAVNSAKQTAQQLILSAIEKAIEKGDLKQAETNNFTVEIPADTKNGDFATNVAMVHSKVFGMPPRKIAEIICENISLENTVFEKTEIAGPGFINLFLSNEYFATVCKACLALGNEYGKTDFGDNKKVIVEFVSANPTGPMHLGNARGGALGDCLAACLDWAGYDVTREFYVNDAGNQIEKFAKSLYVRYLQIFKGEENVELPEDCYQGEDIKVLASEFAQIHNDSLLAKDEAVAKKELVDYALPKNIARLKEDLEKYRIHYDNWFSEKTLHENGEVMRIVDVLKEKGYAYEQDGTIWYKASAFATGKEKEEVKDEVLVRQNGIPTYFAADIAYHYNKFVVRGADICIEVWGADHHGHVARMKNAMNAIGLNGDNLDIVLMQLVKLVRNGEQVRMSKRTGKAITLVDLLEEIPIDSARFFFNLREPASQMEFDLDLAVAQDSDNPVYYVQYAHARICSILRKLEQEGTTPCDSKKVDFTLLTDATEIELIRHISVFPSEIIQAAKNYDSARLTRYTITLATLFHKFYNACRVKGDDTSLTNARLSLCICVKNVLHNALTMLKIDIPEKM